MYDEFKEKFVKKGALQILDGWSVKLYLLISMQVFQISLEFLAVYKVIL